ncbi:hypothetical protein BN7_4547 [Wickerhamomyces ciferrii]|uniref:Uncharacterized protein n=1 Tax=Wickerhamomyces ciferrii (strain ATCC 14091 / BCRC 22168 / CBS 111 / JCM 3599 / NBRC 0793 / NRRL Y-1031 F-60-10) TaxID=1206466 RepID=K0KU69_WICCF|nr:uncharacterized protein BN7_4547 [Wickerhamomyces ciferrii]CCH44969.1 hypothetical protein BN7_4547 [Wickerhamomyces ciferrii]
MVFDGIYKHFNNADQSNTVYNKGDEKTQSGLRKHSLGNNSENFGGTAGGETKSKFDKDDLNEDKIKEQAGKVFEKYEK